MSNRPRRRSALSKLARHVTDGPSDFQQNQAQEHLDVRRVGFILIVICVVIWLLVT